MPLGFGLESVTNLERIVFGYQQLVLTGPGLITPNSLSRFLGKGKVRSTYAKSGLS
jgi:hypothetical protein